MVPILVLVSTSAPMLSGALFGSLLVFIFPSSVLLDPDNTLRLRCPPYFREVLW